MMNTKKIALALSGITSAILGIVCYAMDTGSYEYSKTYGGDAYTGIQNAAAQAANNTQYLARIVKFGLGSILLIAGIVLIIFALGDLISKKVSAPTPAPAIPAPAPAVSAPAPAPVPTPVAEPAVAPVAQSEDAKVCPSCGTTHPVTSVFCANCGSKMDV